MALHFLDYVVQHQRSCVRLRLALRVLLTCCVSALLGLVNAPSFACAMPSKDIADCICSSDSRSLVVLLVSHASRIMMNITCVLLSAIASQVKIKSMLCIG